MIWVRWNDFYVLLGEIQETCTLFCENVVVHVLAWSLRLLNNFCSSFISNIFMPFCVICLQLSPQEKFSPSDCSFITKVHTFSLWPF